MKAAKDFLPRVTMAIGVREFGEENRYVSAIARDHLKVSTVKIILDETTGRLYPSQKELDNLVLMIHQAGMQVSIHAVENTAVESACHAIEQALMTCPNPDHRHRIEHCSVCSPTLAKRLAELKIMVVTQPSFIYYNGDRYLDTISKKDISNLYPTGTLQRSGVIVAGSSDSPIVDPNPITGLYAAVTRRSQKGAVLSEKECIDPLSAIGLFTCNTAKLFFDESVKGSITPGKMADMVLLDRDPVRISPGEIRDVEVVMTIIDGKVVWKSHGQLKL
jgi:predicted amidohydrolase YtcJ